MDQVTRPVLIQLDKIVKRYGAFTALDEVSLNVFEGEFLALLGPSGCGKTTLLRTIAGFCEPTSGSLTIDGRSVLKDPPNQRPVNTVFQNYALFPHMTVHQNVAFGPKRHGVDHHEIDGRVMASLSMVGMENFAHRFPSELSGGQQQRVALARAIINQPKVLLLDEPLAALDLKLRKRMQLELKRLQERLGITFIIVTHDQEEALVMADRIVIMSNGRIEQVGAGKQIYVTPESRYVADFIGEANLIDCRVDSEGRLHAVPGNIELPYSITPGSSATATLMIRPECISTTPLIDAHDRVHSKGMVHDVVYAGSATRIYVRNDMSEEIVIAHAGTALDQPILIGQDISFSWRKDDARVLTK
jgi:spermidine/putrescine transport system ATP-binding protein